MVPSVRLLVALCCVACSGGDPCPEAMEAVASHTAVGGTSPAALHDHVRQADQSIALLWNDGSETRVNAFLSSSRDAGQAVNSPLCIETCAGEDTLPAEACGPDWLITRAAGVLWTDDGRLDGEAMVGRALAIDDQWRLDLVPAKGAEFQGNLAPYEIVELPPDTVEWSVNATMIGTGSTLLLAEVRVNARVVVDGESSTEFVRLGVTP